MWLCSWVLETSIYVPGMDYSILDMKRKLSVLGALLVIFEVICKYMIRTLLCKRNCEYRGVSVDKVIVIWIELPKVHV